MAIETDITFIFKRFRLAVIFIVVLTAAGALGYMVIEGWGLLDAIYMTAITIVAVGYREVGPLGFWGKLFTIALVYGGLTVVAVWVSTATSLYVQRELGDIFRKRKMKKEISKMSSHTILCGAGDTGQHIITQFKKENREIVAIEKDQEHINLLKERCQDLKILEGDATKEEILSLANITNASSLIATLASDADNLFLVISARTLNPKLNIIARAVEDHTREKLIKVGANHVITPSIIEGMRMAALALRPSVQTFMDIVGGRTDLELELEEVEVTQKSPFIGKSLRELEIPQHTGLIVIAINQHTGKDLIFNPSSNTILSAEDRLMVLGKSQKIQQLKEYVN